MKALKIAAILPALLLTAGVLWAATQYGEAVIQKGAMTVVREGKTLKFDQTGTAIPINEQDLIRVRAESLVELKSRENATITLGSNSVFQVKPWQAEGKTGLLRALFGRFRASIVGLTGGEQFNVKTATATIGVKGTEYRTQVTNRGGTMLVVTHNLVGFHGQRGTEINVDTGHLSLILGINPPTPPIPVPPEVNKEFNDDNLDSPPPNSKRGRRFAGQDSLIEHGVTDKDTLDDSSGDSSGGTGGGSTTQYDTETKTIEVPAPRARATLQF
jgi:FecR protein